MTMMILFLSLGHLVFEFVSYFEVMISDFFNPAMADHAIWALT